MSNFCRCPESHQRRVEFTKFVIFSTPTTEGHEKRYFFAAGMSYRHIHKKLKSCGIPKHYLVKFKKSVLGIIFAPLSGAVVGVRYASAYDRVKRGKEQKNGIERSPRRRMGTVHFCASV